MANIVVSMYNFLLKKDKLQAIPPFYEGFINGLRDAGNNVLCFQFDKVLLGSARAIPSEYLKKIKQFEPDIFIFFNNQFWDVTKYFDVPVVIYDVDSPNAYYNLEGVIKNRKAYKFLVNQSDGDTFIKDSVGCDDSSIKYIPPFTEIRNSNVKQDINIGFCGTNWFWIDFKSVTDFTNARPSREDIVAAKKVYDLYIKNPTLYPEEIYEKFDIQAKKRLVFNDLFHYACRISGIQRLRYLLAIQDLGLEIRGQYWLLKDQTLAAFPELLFSYSPEPVNSIRTTQDFFNRSKIGFNTKHIQAKSGFSWRVCDILASNACLVSEYAKDLVDLGFKVPMFESPAEAREQCIKLLENENMRQDIVAHSQEIINKNHRFKHILPRIEDFLNMKLHTPDMGTLEIVQIFNTDVPAKSVETKPAPSSSNPPIMAREKFYIKFAGIPVYIAKRKGAYVCRTYLLGLPFLSIFKTSKSYKVNLLIIQTVIDYINKKKKQLTDYIIQRKNNKAKQLIAQKFKDGKPLNICIQVSRPGMWCFDYLYEMLDKDPRFNVSILIMPDHNYTKEFQQFYLEKTYDELTSKGYNPLKGYDFNRDECINIREEIKPDIMFYTDFWKPHFFDSFYITKFLDKITFLNEYGFSVMQDEKTCAWELNNLVDLYFRPTEIHKQMAQQLMQNKGKNIVVTGSPKLDAIFDKKFKPKDIWKKQKKTNLKTRKKRIIWAPHYTDKMPGNMYQNDAFWEIYDFMLEIAEKYKDKIQFVFRPHPVLKKRAAEKWGLAEQEAYYEKWDSLSNGQYYDGDFVDLFMTSDAMIMDSCSFRAEYTAFDKPLFLTITKTSRLKYNEFGEMLNELFYKPEDDLKQGIIDFIENVVLKGNDTMATLRHEFVQKYFSKINERTASENIYHEIIKFLEEKQ